MNQNDTKELSLYYKIITNNLTMYVVLDFLVKKKNIYVEGSFVVVLFIVHVHTKKRKQKRLSMAMLSPPDPPTPQMKKEGKKKTKRIRNKILVEIFFSFVKAERRRPDDKIWTLGVAKKIHDIDRYTHQHTP